MSALADTLEFTPSPQEFLDSITNLSYSAKILLWYGLSPKTQQGYDSAISSYILFCAIRGIKAWPASESVLVEWISARVFGSAMAKQNRITANTIQSYLSALKSYHIDHHIPTQAFSSPRINRMLRGARFLYPHNKKERLPITKEILTNITSITPISIEEISIWIQRSKSLGLGFLRLGEITYTDAEAQAPIFVEYKVDPLGNHIF